VSNKIVARWQDWSGQRIEHLVLNEGENEITAEAAIIGTASDDLLGARYRIVCDSKWRVSKVEIAEIGNDSIIKLESDGLGNWADGSKMAMPEIGGAIDIDISITPFTNTLPIRRLNLQKGQSEELLVVYFQLPGLAVTTDRQRYTCLESRRRYLYESVESDFAREIEVDDAGLVVTYPGLFRRVL
jgi:uncharacterized protein